MSSLRAYLRGVGLWTPIHASFASWCAAGLPDELAGTPEQAAAAAAPAATLLHPRLRRRTSVFTRATVSALEAAATQADAALEDLRLVLVSSFGEIETTVELLAQLAAPQGPVSPTKFHNSVHNTATGYMSIASGNQRESTALAAGPHNLEMATLELLAGLALDGGQAALLIAEERLPPPFARPDADPSFALALCFGVEPGGLGLDVTLEATPVEAREGEARDGIASMLGPTRALLRAIARLIDDEAAPAQQVSLCSREDPSVDLRWQLTLARTS